MIRTVVMAAALSLAVASPTLAQSSDASADSTRGAATSATNKSTLSTQTGADTGQSPVTSSVPKAAAGQGDSAILNAPGEKVPGTGSKSQPSNLNGQ